MSDIRALLKQKRQEAQINHPLASYTSGSLKCIACGSLVKSAWEGHVGSKAHRQNVAKLRIQREQEMAEEQTRAIRAQQEETRLQTTKRKAEEEEPEQEGAGDSKRARVEEDVPSDFFSDPNARMVVDEPEEETEEAPVQSTVTPAAPVDDEWLAFQSAVINVPDEESAFRRATVFAAPEPVGETAADGFPALAPLREAELEPTSIEVPIELTEDEIRKAKEHDEREMIMDRLIEEEQQQEEADQRVVAMKLRVEALKRARAEKLKGKAARA